MNALKCSMCNGTLNITSNNMATCEYCGSKFSVNDENTIDKEEILLMRIFMFLEDAEWEDARIYCEKVLNINPMCARAYLGKLKNELQNYIDIILKRIETNKNNNMY